HTPVDRSASVSSSSRSSGRSFGRYARAYANVIRKDAVPSCPVDGSPSRPAAAQALPAAVLDLDASPVLALVVEADFHLGGVGAVGSDVPEIAEPAGRFPDRDLAPVDFGAGRRPLEDPAADPVLEHHLNAGLGRDGVIDWPPARGALRPQLECLPCRAVHFEA